MDDTVKWHNSIITRSTLMVTGILAMAVLVAGALTLLEQQRQLKQALGTKATSLVQFMAQVSPLSILSLNFVEMNNNVKKVVQTDDEAVYAVILNDQGIPLVYHFKDTDPLTTRAVRDLVEARKPLPAIEAMKDSGRILEVTAPILVGEKRLGSAILGFSSDKMRRALLILIATIGIVLVVIIGISIALLRLVLRQILLPVQALTAAATRISTGDLNVMLTEIDRNDELGVLSRAFESMANQLRGLIAGLEQREHDLRQLTTFQRTLLDNAAYGIISITPDGIVSSFNPAAERLLGYTATEVIGIMTPLNWHDSEEVARRAGQLSDELGETIEPGMEVFVANARRNLPDEGEWTFIRNDGTRVSVLLSVTALRDENGRITGFVGLANDLTERKRAEERLRGSEQQLREAQEELVRKEKLSILGQLSGSVGHELRNPLGVMSNAVYFLKMVLAEADETTREYLGIIENEIANSLRIITDLLDFARTKPPQRAAVKPGELARQSLERCAIPDNVTVTVEVPDDLPRLNIDPLQMEQVLTNFITNGVQAMPEGGGVRIGARLVSSCVWAGLAPAHTQEGQPQELPLQETANFIEISVADSGEGISPENMKKLFQPLFTTKAKGIGLGLVVCKNLVEANGGRIEVESEAGKGTTFAVVLPVEEK